MKKVLSLALFLAGAFSLHGETEGEILKETKNEAPRTSIVRIYEPSQPKPIGVLPSGWTLGILKDHKIQAAPIPLPTGKSAKISALAYIIIPDEAKGSLLLPDPGYDPKKGLRQTDTIGAILTSYIEEAETLERSLEPAISSLRASLGTSSQVKDTKKK